MVCHPRGHNWVTMWFHTHHSEARPKTRHFTWVLLNYSIILLVFYKKHVAVLKKKLHFIYDDYLLYHETEQAFEEHYDGKQFVLTFVLGEIPFHTTLELKTDCQDFSFLILNNERHPVLIGFQYTPAKDWSPSLHNTRQVLQPFGLHCVQYPAIYKNPFHVTFMSLRVLTTVICRNGSLETLRVSWNRTKKWDDKTLHMTTKSSNHYHHI